MTFKNKRPGGHRINHYFGTPLRRVVIDRPDIETPLILVTNDLKRSAVEIGDCYRQRWEIKLFFKWLKQNLAIKKLLGRSKNAVHIQIYVAIMTYLLVHQYRANYKFKNTMKRCLALLKTGLFQRPEVVQEVSKRRKRRLEQQSHRQGALPIDYAPDTSAPSRQ